MKCSLLNNIALAYYKSNHIEYAIKYNKKSIEINEKCLKAYLRLAVCYIRLSKFEDAKATLHLANELAPNHQDILKIMKHYEM